MDKVMAADYKLHLSFDMIVFLCYTILFQSNLNSASFEKKIELTDDMLVKWNTRLESNLSAILNQTLAQVAKENGWELDEAKIMSSIHQIEPSIIRKEFLDEIRNIIHKSLDVQKTT